MVGGLLIMAHNGNELPRFIYDEIYELAGEKTRKKLAKYIFRDTEIKKDMFDSYIEELVSTHFASDDENVIDITDIYNTVSSRVKKTKRNWFKQLKQDVDNNHFSAIHVEYDFFERFIETHGGSQDISPFTSISLNDFINQRLKEIEEWSLDPESKITDYPYLDSKQTYQIKKAFDNDFILLISDFLRRSPKNLISLRANSLITNPVFTPDRYTLSKKGKKKRQDFNLPEVSGSGEISVSYDDYILSDNKTLIRSIIRTDHDEEVHLKRTFR